MRGEALKKEMYLEGGIEETVIYKENQNIIIPDLIQCSESILIMSFIKEFYIFLKSRKKYWLLPIIIMLVVFGGLIILSQGSALAPFIYAIF